MDSDRFRKYTREQRYLLPLSMKDWLPEPQYSESYNFCIYHNDTAAFWFNGQLRFNLSDPNVAEHCTGGLALIAGTKYPIQLNFADAIGNASVKLYWQSASQPKQIIPYNRLFPETPAPTPTGTPANGNGLTGEYFTSNNLTNLAYTQTDPLINFAWGTGSPTGLPVDNFSIRWTGFVQPQYSETYTFCVERANNDATRLWINNQKLVDTDYYEAGEACGSIALSAGVKYSLKLDYTDGLNNALVKLRWQSASRSKEIIPYSRLFPESPAPTPTGTPANGTGLTGEYYTTTYFANLAYTQIDPAVNFDWGAGSPTGLPANFSIRWTGYVQPRFSETHTFCIGHANNDGEKVWVNGQKIIDDSYWDYGSACGSIALTAGVKYSIVVEYSDGLNNARAQLSWYSPTQYQEIIPASQLFPANPTPTPTITSTPTQTPTPTLTPTATMTPTLTMPSGQIWKYYYYAGSQPVAVRVTGSQNPQENGLFYTLGDQLGSTSVIADSSGNKVGEMRYMPWGETRYEGSNIPTSRKYTGQREDAGIELYYYDARWYDPQLGRFAQADSLISEGVGGFDRYAYVNNSPIEYIDPSGHEGCGDIAWGGARDLCFATESKGMTSPRPTEMSEKGKEVLKCLEAGPEGNCKPSLIPYNDAGGNCTIGWGHETDPYDPKPCQPSDFKKWAFFNIFYAEMFFTLDVWVAEKIIRDNQLDQDLTQQYQYDALVTFIINAGLKYTKRSGIPTDLRNGNIGAIPDDMNKIVYIGNEFSPGLSNRRCAEGNMFRTGDYYWQKCYSRKKP